VRIINSYPSKVFIFFISCMLFHFECYTTHHTPHHTSQLTSS
jgi:hypothetical protein